MREMIDGIGYNVESCGSGFPLVLLHGFTADASSWQPFCPILGKHSRLLMVDLIGHGQSDSPPDPTKYEIEKAARDLMLLLAKMGIEKIDLFGYSMGGRVAITFAAMYPERVRKLVLESTTAGLPSASEKKARIEQDHALANRIETEGIEWFVDHWQSIPLFHTQSSLSADRKEKIRNQRLQNNPLGLANSLRGMGTGSQPSWWDKLGTFECETLMITGSLDEKFCTIAEKMAMLIPNAKHLSINGCGHAIHVEQPEKFGTIISEFLFTT